MVFLIDFTRPVFWNINELFELADALSKAMREKSLADLIIAKAIEINQD